jgi:hypothetical protein
MSASRLTALFRKLTGSYTLRTAGQRMRLRTGLVKSVDHSQRTANVLWHRGTQHRVPGPTCTTPECLAQQEKMLAETAEQYREIPPSLDVAPYEEVVSVYTIEVSRAPSFF